MYRELWEKNMKLSVYIEINASKEQIWRFITDRAKWVDHIGSVLAVTVINESDAFLGFKWRETRMMFGKEADETMWVTDVVENQLYKTRAESHGSVYITTISIEDKGDKCILRQEFEGIPQKLMGKIMLGVMGGMIRKLTEKELYADLVDIKSYLEKA